MLEPALANETVALSLIDRSDDLQQRICAMYYHDFTCGGYELLPACKGEPSTWLPQAVRNLLEDAPLTALGSHSHARSGHDGVRAASVGAPSVLAPTVHANGFNRR